MFARLGVVACVVAAVLITPGVVSASKMSSGSSSDGSALYQNAKSKPANGGSAVDQYDEICSTPSGPKPCKSIKKTTPKLSKKATNALSSTSASTRDALNEVVSRSEQPKQKAKHGKTKLGQVTLGPIPKDQDNSSFGGALTAALASIGTGSTARLAVLLAAVVGISAAIGVIAVRKQRI